MTAGDPPEGPPEMEANAEQSTRKRSGPLGCVLAALALGVVLVLVWPMLPRPQPTRTCLSNVKNIALAFQMYVADNDDGFPPADGWCDRIHEYVWTRDVYRCEQAEELDCAFAHNAALDGASLATLPHPARTIVIFESDRGWNAAGGRPLLPDDPRHLNGDHYGFADGSARWIKRKGLPDGTWAKEPDADVIWEAAVGPAGARRAQAASPSRLATTHVEVPFLRPAPDRLRSPVGVATGDDTDLYVLDEATSIVKEFSPQGHWVRDLKVAGPLSLDSGVLVSQCLAHDRGGGLLVSDARQGVVHRLGPAGHALEDLRVPADASGRLEAIYAAADSQGNIYVATRPGAVIRKYGSDRRLLWERGFDTTGSYPFSESVRAITVGPRDRLWVWVLDYRMLVFDHNGQYATERSQEKWGEPVAGAFDRQGNRYEVWFETVAGYGTDLIKFDSDGQQLWRHNWVAVRGTGLTVTADGHAFVTLQDYKFTAAPCVEVSPDGEEIRLIGSNGTRLGEVRDPSGLAIDAAGNLYVGDYYAYRVQRFGSDGKFLGEVIGPGIPRSSTQQIEAPDGFGAPSSIAVDAARRIHVTHYDGLDQMLSVFSLAGASESGLPKIPLGYGGYTDTHFGASPRFPASVALDAAGNIWTAMGVEPQLVEGKAEPGSDHLRGGGVRVSKYDPTGKMVLSFGGYGSGPGLFGRHDKEGVSASLLAIGGEGTVWVVDRGNSRVQQFDREGRFLGQIGPEVGGLVLDRPWGAVVDERAHVYVADQRYIFECSPNGAFVAAVAILDESPSADRDEFLSRYRGIAVDQSGSIYITDAARESVRRFAPRAGIDG